MRRAVWLFLSLKGRLSLLHWWGAMAALCAVTVGLIWVSGRFGLGPWSEPSGDTQSSIDTFGALGWYGAALTLLMAFPFCAVSIKRRHDRGHSGLDVVIYAALLGLRAVWRAMQLGFTAAESSERVVSQSEFSVFFVWMPEPPPAYHAFGTLLGCYAIYLLAILGFSEGTRGANGYGPDPLAAAAQPVPPPAPPSA